MQARWRCSRVSDPGFLRDVEERGAYLRARLEAMQGITEVRGMGMMLGAVLAERRPARSWRSASRRGCSS